MRTHEVVSTYKNVPLAKAHEFLKKRLHVGCIEKGHESPFCGHCGLKQCVPYRRFHDELVFFKALGMKWVCRKCRRYYSLPSGVVTRRKGKLRFRIKKYKMKALKHKIEVLLGERS